MALGDVQYVTRRQPGCAKPWHLPLSARDRPGRFGRTVKPTLRRLLAIAIAALAFPGAAAAQLYKCTENGKVTYRERPCDSGAEDRMKARDARALAAPGHPTKGAIRRNPGATTAPPQSGAPQGPVADADAPARP